MSLHLFSTPVQCTRCGTVVDDPTVDKCPTCGNLLKERRAPRRLAGVETRYSGLRTLLGVLRFLGVLVLLLGGLVFFSTLGDDGLSGTQGAAMFVGSIVVAVLMFAAAGAFVLMMDIEENTRSAFRMQQRMLENMDAARPDATQSAVVEGSVPVSPAVAEGSVPVPPAAAPARPTLEGVAVTMTLTRRTAVPGALALALMGGGLLAVNAGTQTGTGPLQAQAAAMVPNPGEWSILAWSLDRNEPLFAFNAEKAVIPASNNKVYSAIWALGVLGPDYRFPTDMLITGPVEGGVLRGDVVIRGSGDPAFGYPDYDKDPMDSPRKMAAALQRMGVRTVQGGVIADPSVHDQVNYGPDWPRDTGNGAARYAPTVSGLPFNRNMLWVRMTPGQGQGFIREPDVPEIPIISRASGGANAYAVRKPEEDTVRIRGGTRGRFGVGAYEPAWLAGGALRQALREAGIQVTGPLRIAKTPQGAAVVHRHFSIPLMEMAFQLGRHSDNFFAEHLWKAAVAKATGKGTFVGGGAASALFFHDQAGVPWGQIWQADGSGLSAQNRTSANALVRALMFAHRQPWGARFHESLAIAGDRGGSMSRMFVGTPAAGNLHAKTGYINDVRTLSGFVKTASGENVVFSFLYNGRNTGGARGVQTNLGNLLATYSR